MRPACVRAGGRSCAAGRGRPPSHAPSSDPREPAARPQSPRAARPGRLLRQLPFPLMPPQSPRVTRSNPPASRTAAPNRPPRVRRPPRRTAARSSPPHQAHRRAHPTSPLLSTRQLAGSKTRFFWQAMTGLQRLFRHQELLSQGGGIATWGFPGARRHRPRPSRRPRGAKGCKPVITCQKTGPILPRNPADYDLHGSPPARPEKRATPDGGSGVASNTHGGEGGTCACMRFAARLRERRVHAGDEAAILLGCQRQRGACGAFAAPSFLADASIEREERPRTGRRAFFTFAYGFRCWRETWREHRRRGPCGRAHFRGQAPTPREGRAAGTAG